MKHVAMKKMFVFIAFTFISFGVSAQIEGKKSPIHAVKDSTLIKIHDRVDDIYYRMNRSNRYKLYPTENIYTFLKLNTATGQIEQLQWSLDEKNEGTFTINAEDLSLIDMGSGRFELYPTQNMYQFILLDTSFLGRSWHVQWGIGDKKRWIRRIY